jgi:hypothetical protein
MFSPNEFSKKFGNLLCILKLQRFFEAEFLQCAPFTLRWSQQTLGVSH